MVEQPESRRSRREAERRRRLEEDQNAGRFFAELAAEAEVEFGGGLGARDGGERPRYPSAAEADPGYVPQARPRPRYPQPGDEMGDVRPPSRRDRSREPAPDFEPPGQPTGRRAQESAYRQPGPGYPGAPGPTPPTPPTSGYGSNGSSSNGYGDHGSSNGYGSNGSSDHGYGNNGYGSNGSSDHGYVSNGSSGNGSSGNGYVSNGHGSNGYGGSGYQVPEPVSPARQARDAGYLRQESPRQEPERYQSEPYQPESQRPRTYPPQSYQPQSYQPQSYQPQPYQPESYPPQSYQPEYPPQHQPEPYREPIRQQPLTPSPDRFDQPSARDTGYQRQEPAAAPLPGELLLPEPLLPSPATDPGASSSPPLSRRAGRRPESAPPPATPASRRRTRDRWDEPEIPAPLLGQDVFEEAPAARAGSFQPEPYQSRTVESRPYGGPRALEAGPSAAPGVGADDDTRAGGLPSREIVQANPLVTTGPARPQARTWADEAAERLAAEPDLDDDEDEYEEDDRPEPGPLRRWMLRVATLLLFGWAVLTLTPGSSGIVASLAAGASILAAVAIPVIAVGVHDRRWGSVVVCGLAAILPWALVVGYAVPARNVPTDGPVVRVMTANAKLGQADPRQLAAAVQDHAVDILVITELTGALAHELTAAGIDNVLVPRWVKVDSDPSSGIGVWSRFPVDQLEDLPGFTRPAGRMVVQTPQGNVTLVAAHVKAPYPPHFPFAGDAASWRQDLIKLRQVARQTNKAQLVVGDFNATPWNADFRLLADAGLADAADVAGKGIRPTWPTWSPVPLLPLDHVMIGGPIGVASVNTLSIAGSDHRALLVSMLIPGSG